MEGKSPAPEVCSHKLAFAFDNFVRKIFQCPQRVIGPYVELGQTAIDLGCGPGFFTIAMADREL